MSPNLYITFTWFTNRRYYWNIW